MLICKVHPFYPARIHLLEEECNYAIHLSSFAAERRLCTSIECEEWQLEELSLFYKWLYGQFPENRLMYILHSLAHFDGTAIPNEEVIEALMKGSDVSCNIVYRP